MGIRPVEEDKQGHEITEEVAAVKVMNIDADKFVGETDEKWNVIFVDMPDPSSIDLTKLYSKEFYLKLNRILAENGVIVIQSTSPYHAKEAYLNIKRTVEAARFNTVPYHDNVPSFGDWGWILAWKNNRGSVSTMKNRIESIDSFEVETKYLTPEVFKKALVFGKGMLDSKFDDISTLMEPTILERYLKSWDVT